MLWPHLAVACFKDMYNQVPAVHYHPVIAVVALSTSDARSHVQLALLQSVCEDVAQALQQKAQA
jgi:hypothetical protein